MEILKKLEKISSSYQKVLENLYPGSNSGTCYLSAKILEVYLSNLGFDARCVTGELRLRDKSEKRIIIYGETKETKRQILIGYYHCWCELYIDGVTYILDPSMKYNLRCLKKLGYKFSNKIPGSLVTTQKSGYYWKFTEDKTLEPRSNHYISNISNEMITNFEYNLKIENNN